MTNESTDYDKLQSQTISFLRFFLIIGVVFLHTYVFFLAINGKSIISPSSNAPLFYYSAKFVSKVIGHISVPAFFFISGFLFFLKIDFTKIIFKRKLTSRIKTLLIPYLFWNSITLLSFYLAQSIPQISKLSSGGIKLISDYCFIDYLHAYGIGQNHPISLQFWFIRDLMIIVIISPIIYYLIKKFKSLIMFSFGILWYFRYWPSINFLDNDITALFFFCLGAYFSINKKNLVLEFRKIFLISVMSYPVFALADLLTKETHFNIYIHNIGILIGIVFFFNIATFLLEKKYVKVNTFLTSASFFVFAFHEPCQMFLIKILFKTIQPNNDFMLTFLYFLAPTIIILITLVLYYYLGKFFPKFTKFITGGR